MTYNAYVVALRLFKVTVKKILWSTSSTRICLCKSLVVNFPQSCSSKFDSYCFNYLLFADCLSSYRTAQYLFWESPHTVFARKHGRCTESEVMIMKQLLTNSLNLFYLIRCTLFTSTVCSRDCIDLNYLEFGFGFYWNLLGWYNDTFTKESIYY